MAIEVVKTYRCSDGRTFAKESNAKGWEEILDNPKKRVCAQCRGKGKIDVCTNGEEVRERQRAIDGHGYMGEMSGPPPEIKAEYKVEQCPTCGGKGWQELKGQTEPVDIWK